METVYLHRFRGIVSSPLGALTFFDQIFLSHLWEHVPTSRD